MKMIEVKTDDLVGAALDFAVAEVEVRKRLNTTRKQFGLNAPAEAVPAYSTNWAHGGPMIDKYLVHLDHIGSDFHGKPLDFWVANNDSNGGTALIAAMRAIVAAKLGDKVSVPAELLTSS